MNEIQKFFSSGASQIEIPPGEYAGPLTIRNSCIVDGHGATLWTKSGVALIIDASNVTVKNFRVELMTKTKEFIAIDVLQKNVRLENIEVYGNIRGLENVSESWDLPRTIDFGNFAAGKQNEFSGRFKINEPCHVINSVYGLNIAPQTFSPGEFDLRFTVNPMKDGMILYGSFLLETANKILRRIYVSGRAQNGAAIKTLPKVQSVPPTSQKITSKTPQQVETDTGRKFFPVLNFPPQETQTGAKKKFFPVSNKIKEGQKIFAPHSEDIKIMLKVSDFPNNMTIDACAFCLGKNKKVQRDTDFIFFNNPRHESLSVSLFSKENMPGIDLNLKNIPAAIQTVVIYFSIYDEGNRLENNFSKLPSPEVVVFADENIFKAFPLQLGSEKIFKALEIYRDKADWRIHFIGLGSEKNLKKICESYGVEVF